MESVLLSAQVVWYANGRRLRLPYANLVMPQLGEYLKFRRRANGKVYARRYKIHTIEHRVDDTGATSVGYTVVRMTRYRLDREVEWRKNGNEETRPKARPRILEKR